MSVIVPKGWTVHDSQRDWELKSPEAPAHGGNGGGGMDYRVNKLEDEMKAVRSDLTDIKVTLARIETELGHKISYKWMALYIAGLAAIILRTEIASLFGA